ncbi:hypothetical protein OHA38_43765 (plasmid) [Streptomyces sp. NBC_01732]|uniref:hypothetical protein n=1 Tax=Streptomyces sp. NBC_01732 TaxID=2975926 RepID=UPI00352C910D|nr:hypothetical protein OHA38_43765 [Streptomyces sp. NBC_01732]
MTICPTHRSIVPPPPAMPHSTQADSRVCKGCAAPAGSQEERRNHHCPCCGERFMNGCTGCPRCRTCHRCGTIDTHTNRWLPPVDPIAELLGQQYTPSLWFQVWEEAALRFGRDIAHHLVQATTEIDQTHLYGKVVFRGSVIVIRHGSRGFEAASDCPRRTECRRGRVWTPVQAREDLLSVHLNGPGPRASACDRAHRHS